MLLDDNMMRNSQRNLFGFVVHGKHEVMKSLIPLCTIDKWPLIGNVNGGWFVMKITRIV